MAYSQEEKDEKFNLIISEIENGSPLRKVLAIYDMPSSSTFYKWLEEKDEEGNLTEEAKEKTKRYARACEERADNLFEEILEIVDDGTNDVEEIDMDGIVIEKVNHEHIQRSRLRYDARRWMIGKMNPKKYGDKIQQEISGELKTTPTELKVTIRKPEEEED